MLVKEDILRDALREAISDVMDISIRPLNKVDKQIQKIALSMFNITGGEITYILNGRTPVEILSEEVMFKISKILYEYISHNPGNFDVERLNVNTYFTKDEQERYSKKIERVVIEKDLIFDYYVPISKDQVIVSLSNKQLLELVSLNKIHYNPETQRQLTTIETSVGKIKKITINRDAYNEIYDAMYSGDYISNLLVFNLNPDSSVQPRIIGKKFVIPKEAVIDCIDGFHRLLAAIAVSKINPDWEINFIIEITGFDVQKAKRYILQEDKKTHLTEEQVTQDDQYDAANFIIEKLQNSLYLKNCNIPDIKFTLNKIINQVFKPVKIKSSENIQKAVKLFKDIEHDINALIEEKNLFGKNFSKGEWFIYLYLIKYCNDNNKDFIGVINRVNIDELTQMIAITKEPIKKHYKIMEDAIKNV